MRFLFPTGHPSRLLGNELDSIIFQLKNLFKQRNIPFPLIYNSTDLIHKLQNFDNLNRNIKNLNNYNLSTFDFTSLYTNILLHCTRTSPTLTPSTPSSPAANSWIYQSPTETFYLIWTILWTTETFLFQVTKLFNRPKESLWAANTVGKLLIWCCS